MQILLNGEELDVRLEDEKLLTQFLCGIADWMEADACYLKEFTIDGSRYALAEQPDGTWDFELFQQELESIDKLELFSEELQAYSQQQQLLQARQGAITSGENTILESLKILCDYFQIAHSAFESRKFIFLQDLFSEAGSLLELLGRCVTQAESALWHDGSSRESAGGAWSQGNPEPSVRSFRSSEISHKGQSHENSCPQHGKYENPLLREFSSSLELWNYFQDSEQNAQIVIQWEQGAGREDRDRMLAILQDVVGLLMELYKDYEQYLSSPASSEGEKRDLRQSFGVRHPNQSLHSQHALPQAELASPRALCDSSVGEIKLQLKKKSGELGEAVLQLQNGQIDQCLYCVSELSLLLEQLLQQVKSRENSRLPELFRQLNPFLQELTLAIGDTDTVSMGDLVEYEILPLIQQIINELS